MGDKVTPAGMRIAKMLDGNSFVEFGAKIQARSTDFNIGQEKSLNDGVITGYGLIDGNLVYVYSQDASVMGGSIGEMHAKKILSLYNMAMKTGAPVIGLIDCAGLRLQEATDSLNAFSEIYLKQSLASGVIPQITAVFGQCGGGLAIVPAITDFTFMESGAKLFVNSPNALAGNTKDKCDTSSAAFQSEETGIVDGVGTEDEILAQIRELVSMLPGNNEEVAFDECADDLNRVCEGLAGAAGDTAILLANIADNNLFIEKAPSYAPEMVTGLLRLNGVTVGAIANRSEAYGEDGSKTADYGTGLSANGCRKAAEFVNFCDAFNIPVLTITNADGFCACKCTERRIAKAAAALVSALANATVAKVNLIVGKAYGSAYAIMNSKGLGADLVVAWPQAEIGMMDAAMAAKVMYGDAGAEKIKEGTEAYKALQNSVESAAGRGYVDVIINPEDTRKYLIGAFEMLYTKKEDRPAKKHGAIL